MKSRFFAAVALAFLLFAVTLSAHHSNAAQFDSTKRVTMKGEITKIEWTNPHARIYIDVKDDKGKVVNWDCELGPPNGLMRRGWNRNSLKQGHVVTINGFLSKTAPHVANARTVKLADGREVFAGSSFDTGPTEGDPPAK